jgi:phosphinothricin acetyltransferase
VRDIFEQGLATGLATFETSVPEREEWDREHLSACRLVAVLEGDVAGWAALSPVSDRCVYGGVAELSVYVDPACQGKGVGSMLLESLVRASEDEGFWTLQAGIFPENEGSVRLHERCGFRVIGCRERLGKLGDRWQDVLLLERRSTRVGVS